MDEYDSLSHSKWECKYHVVFIPKCPAQDVIRGITPTPWEVFRRLAEQKESRVEEGHLMLDHVHMMISIRPKYAVSQVIGYIQGLKHRTSIRHDRGSLRHPALVDHGRS